MATETAAVAVAQTGETQNTEVALTATPDTESYNTVIEMLKSRELALSVTQLELLESVTRQLLDRNSAHLSTGKEVHSQITQPYWAVLYYRGLIVPVPYYSAHCDYQVQLLWTWTVGRTEDWLWIHWWCVDWRTLTQLFVPGSEYVWVLPATPTVSVDDRDDTVITVKKADWDDTGRLWIQSCRNRSKHSTENAED